jgi:pimeloyl-ACP methyl ester carboxylesterase
VIVFVHGVPETAELWDKVRAAIGRESTAVSLPGFGCFRPDGFGASKDEYAAWLRDQVVAIGEPVDIVGHDWGAPLAYRLAATQPETVRSWAIDVANVLHPDYEWHSFAQIWQTPGEGEAFFEAQAQATPEERAPIFESMGVPHDDAVAMSAKSDDTMSDCIMALYRSATPNPYADWKDSWGPVAAPGLVLHPTDDPFGDEALAADTARVTGARFETLDGLGHWWPLQGPDAGAAALVRFWDSL